MKYRRVNLIMCSESNNRGMLCHRTIFCTICSGRPKDSKVSEDIDAISSSESLICNKVSANCVPSGSSSQRNRVRSGLVKGVATKATGTTSTRENAVLQQQRSEPKRSRYGSLSCPFICLCHCVLHTIPNLTPNFCNSFSAALCAHVFACYTKKFLEA